jgi:predicted RNA-binding protein with PIN domain
VCEYLLVDGYNIIFAWEELNELAAVNMDAARLKLQDILSDYQGFYKCVVIIVFDGYKAKGNQGSVLKYHNIHVVYTKEAVTADQYIERITGEIVRKARVRVATSDRLEQMIVLGLGASRLSAGELNEEIQDMKKHIRENYINNAAGKRNSLIDNLSPEMAEYMAKLRLKETDR